MLDEADQQKPFHLRMSEDFQNLKCKDNCAKVLIANFHILVRSSVNITSPPPTAMRNGVTLFFTVYCEAVISTT